MLGKIIGSILQNAGNGVYGERVKSLYWALKGKKTAVGVVASAMLAGIWYYGTLGDCSWCKGVVEIILAVVGGLGITLGQIDGALHIDPPTK